MRFTSGIILSLLIQLGLFGLLAADESCCSKPAPQHSRLHCHDHGPGAPGHCHGDCACDHETPDRQSCPPDCGERHHHHGNCMHGMQMSVAGNADCRLNAPLPALQRCERHHLRAPDGPVMELDKPPLI